MKHTTQMDYKILSGSNVNNLETDVAEWTAKGYRLVGGVSAYLDSQSRTVFIQAVAAELA